MAIVPAVAGGLVGTLAAGLNGIYQANQLLNAAYENRDQLVEVRDRVRHIYENLPRPPPGKRLRGEQPASTQPATQVQWQAIGSGGLSRDRAKRRRYRRR